MLHVDGGKCSAFEMFGVFGNSRVPVTVRTYLIEKSGMGINGESHYSFLVAERDCVKRQQETNEQWNSTISLFTCLLLLPSTRSLSCLV